MSGQGFFEKLPAEVFDLILNHLSAVEASVFSMVSKSISNCIIRHLSTSAWRNQMILQKFHCTSPKAEHLNTILDHFRSLGLLFKRCTLLLPTKERLKFIYNTFSQIPCFRIEQCDVLPLCQGFACYGVFLQTLIAGWDELECQRVFNFLCKTTHLQWKIEAAVASKPEVSCLISGKTEGMLISGLHASSDPGQSSAKLVYSLSSLAHCSQMVSEKDGYCMNWVVKMIQQVCQVFSVALEKRAFIERMENMFSEVTMELVELVMAGHRNGELDTALRSLNSLLIANAHFHTEIVCIFLKKE
ncbi:hypothetical protein PHYPO_G00201550 [Pangasianodon hypophthalmus]|uniref:F-box domain-containing protein n=1 Tax=Pangasianodon hypophthalmus TaxID=310915 RepID=A0A5N5PC02_PANHP|nr:hypothetical protein PHYPO_G00201550 [Pangasianodon hypophthalmus]